MIRWLILLLLICSCDRESAGKLKFEARNSAIPPEQRTSDQVDEHRHVEYAEVADIMYRYSCDMCHDWAESESTLLSGDRINRDEPAKSRLYQILAKKKIPPTPPFLTDDELQTVLDYIKSLND